MARFSHLPLYIKTYEFIKRVYLIVRQFRKEYKFTLGQDMINLIWLVLDGIIEANSLPAPERIFKIEEISRNFDRFKLRLRLAFEIGLLSREKFSSLQLQLAEIGKMIGGWRKWSG